MAAGDIHIINGIRYQEHEAIRRGLLDKEAKPVKNKARKAPASRTSTSEGGSDGGAGGNQKPASAG